MWPWIIGAAVAVLAVILIGQYRTARSTHIPLSQRQPERQTREVPLGMEGLDLEEVSRANRRNESLERGQTNWLSQKGFFGRPDTDVQPLATDETYARRFHAAFQKDKSKD